MTREKQDEEPFILKAKNSTLGEIVAALDSVIDEYSRKPKLISFSALLIKHKLYRSKMHWWNTTYPRAVGERYSILQDIRESRLEELLTTPKGKSERKLPVASGIFYAKCCGMIEEEQVRRLENGGVGEKINLTGDITIGFAEEVEEVDYEEE